MNDRNQDSPLTQNRSIVHGLKMMTFWIGISWIWLLDDFQDRKRAYSVILTERPTLPVYHVVNTKNDCIKQIDISCHYTKSSFCQTLFV